MRPLFALAALLAAACATPSVALEGAWRLESMDGADLVEARAPTLTLDAGRASGNASCNRFSGGYRRDREALVFTPLAATEMACIGDHGPPNALMEQEARFLGALAGRVGVSQPSPDTLVLTSAGGRVLRFRRVQ